MPDQDRPVEPEPGQHRDQVGRQGRQVVTLVWPIGEAVATEVDGVRRTARGRQPSAHLFPGARGRGDAVKQHERGPLGDSAGIGLPDADCQAHAVGDLHPLLPRLARCTDSIGLH